ncbi:MAG: hypothetical protein GY822_01095 [Deltaproteobacteria bacterium]|nr:hypothetical protein [Deltaproteobacteria bacterium]
MSWCRRSIKNLTFVALAVLFSVSAQAVGSADIGENHLLVGTTQIQVDLLDSSEVFHFWGVEENGNSIQLLVQPPLSPAQNIALEVPQSFGGEVGTWTISFSFPDGSPRSRIHFEATVVDAAQVEIVGRVHSQLWTFDATSYTQQTNHAFYIPVATTGGTVLWMLEFNGLAGHEFLVAGSRTGVQPPYSGWSVPMQGNRFIADYAVYLDEPTLALAEAGSSLLSDVVLDGGQIQVQLANEVSLRVGIDLDQDGTAFSDEGEALYSEVLSAGEHTIELPRSSDGHFLDGRGVPIPSGTQRFVVEAREAEFHFTAMDVEFCRPGVRIHRKEDADWVPSQMHWNDKLIDDGTLGPLVTPQAGISSGQTTDSPQSGVNAHGWGGPLGNTEGPGNLSYVDTWVAANQQVVVVEAVVNVVPNDEDGGLQFNGDEFDSDAGNAQIVSDGGELTESPVIDGGWEFSMADAGVSNSFRDAGGQTSNSHDGGEQTTNSHDGGAAQGEQDAGPGWIDDDVDGGFIEDDAGFAQSPSPPTSHDEHEHELDFQEDAGWQFFDDVEEASATPNEVPPLERGLMGGTLDCTSTSSAGSVFLLLFILLGTRKRGRLR